MVYLYDACDQISDFCHQQLLRKISWTDRGKTVYPPQHLRGAGYNKIVCFLYWTKFFRIIYFCKSYRVICCYGNCSCDPVVAGVFCWCSVIVGLIFCSNVAWQLCFNMYTSCKTNITFIRYIYKVLLSFNEISTNGSNGSHFGSKYP